MVDVASSKKYIIFKLSYRKTPHIVPPDGLNIFFIFWALRPGYYVQQCIFFPTISGPFSHNLDRDIDPRSRFFEFFSLFYSYIVPGLSAKISFDSK
jgi:hypothetical protein